MTKARKNYIRIAACALLLAMLVCAFGAAEISTSAAAYTLKEDTTSFDNIAEIAGSDVLIPDNKVFSLEDAQISSNVSSSSGSSGWILDTSAEFVNSPSSEASPAIYWNAWGSAYCTTETVAEGSSYIWKQVTTNEGFTLKWTGAAKASDGTVLDIEITVGQVVINYISRKSALGDDGNPAAYPVVMFSSPSDCLYLSSNQYGEGVSSLVYAVEVPMTISFYRTGTSTKYDGTYCLYCSDVDITDRFTGYYKYLSGSSEAYNDTYITQYCGCADNSAFQEKWTIVTAPAGNTIYCYDDTSLSLDTSSGTVYGAGTDVINPYSSTTAAFYAALPSKKSSITYTSSGGAYSRLFDSYEESCYRLYLTKEGTDSAGNDVSSDFSISGALFEVKDSAGYVKGYFITLSGRVFQATSNKTEAYSTTSYVTYNGTNYYMYAYESGGSSYVRSYMLLPAGTYTVTELKAPDNYQIADPAYQTVTLSYSSQSVTVTFTDVISGYPVVIRKYTSSDYTKDSGSTNQFINANNGYSLEGAVYRIYDSDLNLVETLTTGSQNLSHSYTSSAYAYTETVYLPAGDYYICEYTASSGYLLTNDLKYSGLSYSAKITVTAGSQTQYFDVYEDIDSAQLSLQKVDGDGNNIEQEGISFKVVYSYQASSGSTAKRILYYQTDENGYIDFNDSSYLTSGSPPVDSSGNIIFGAGTLTITENTGPSGYLMSDEEITVTLSLDSSGNLSAEYSSSAQVSNNVISVVNEKMTADTELLDSSNGTHYSSASESMSLTDTVSYDNFSGGTYTFKAQLYDLTTGAYAVDDDGNEITVTKKVMVSSGSDSGTAELSYSFSGTSLAGHTLVSFVYVYSGSSAGTDVLVRHADESDSDQTVYITGIETALTDSENGSRVSAADSSVVLKDAVSITNLPAGSSFTITAQLYDLTAGSYAVDDSGNTITSTYAASSKSGGSVSKTLTYKFSGTSLAGHVLVSYVTLTDTSSGSVLAAEQDPENADQTVYLPLIDTVLTGSDGSSKSLDCAGSAALADSVSITAIPEGTFKLESVLVSSSDPAQEVTLTSGGETEFTSDSAYITSALTQTVELYFEGTGLNGDYTAYEYLYYKTGSGWALVASHEDALDSDQTVSLYSTADVIVYKVDADDKETPIEGAVYQIYNSSDELIAEFTTDEDGSSGLIEGLVCGTYYLYETEAAPGYFLDETVHEFTVDSSNVGTTIEIRVTDSGLVILPSTGAAGILLIITASLTLTAAGTNILMKRSKKRTA